MIIPSLRIFTLPEGIATLSVHSILTGRVCSPGLSLSSLSSLALHIGQPMGSEGIWDIYPRLVITLLECVA